MFDYRCRNCGNIFEELVFSRTMSDNDIVCPDCNKNESDKLISAPAVAVGNSSCNSRADCPISSGFS